MRRRRRRRESVLFIGTPSVTLEECLFKTNAVNWVEDSEEKGEESVSGAAEEPEGLRLRLGPATFCPPRQVNDTDKPEDALRP